MGRYPPPPWACHCHFILGDQEIPHSAMGPEREEGRLGQHKGVFPGATLVQGLQPPFPSHAALVCRYPLLPPLPQRLPAPCFLLPASCFLLPALAATAPPAFTHDFSWPLPPGKQTSPFAGVLSSRCSHAACFPVPLSHQAGAPLGTEGGQGRMRSLAWSADGQRGSWD